MTVSVRNTATPKLKRIKQQVKLLPRELLVEVKKNTPKRTGNARRKTRLAGDTIKLQYPYATELNDGASRQAPQGIIKPSLDWLRRRFRQIIRSAK